MPADVRVTDAAPDLQSSSGRTIASRSIVAPVNVLRRITCRYAGNRCWTFRHRQRIAILRETIRCATLHGVGLAVQLSCVTLTTCVLGQHGKLSFGASLVIGTGLRAAIRFWSCREGVVKVAPRVKAAMLRAALGESG